MMNAARGADLVVRTRQFAIAIIRLYSCLPRSAVSQVLGRQMLRSGTSVGAQYREAIRAKSVADFVSKIEGSLQEIEETRYWLELMIESELLRDVEKIHVLMKEAGELTAILVASARTAKRGKAK
jgi:four helix bundle protein